MKLIEKVCLVVLVALVWASAFFYNVSAFEGGAWVDYDQYEVDNIDGTKTRYIGRLGAYKNGETFEPIDTSLIGGGNTFDVNKNFWKLRIREDKITRIIDDVVIENEIVALAVIKTDGTLKVWKLRNATSGIGSGSNRKFVNYFDNIDLNATVFDIGFKEEFVINTNALNWIIAQNLDDVKYIGFVHDVATWNFQGLGLVGQDGNRITFVPKTITSDNVYIQKFGETYGVMPRGYIFPEPYKEQIGLFDLNHFELGISEKKRIFFNYNGQKFYGEMISKNDLLHSASKALELGVPLIWNDFISYQNRLGYAGNRVNTIDGSNTTLNNGTNAWSAVRNPDTSSPTDYDTNKLSVLMAFDDIKCGTGDNPIPCGSTVTGATLYVRGTLLAYTSPGSISFAPVLKDWDENTSSWICFKNAFPCITTWNNDGCETCSLTAIENSTQLLPDVIGLDGCTADTNQGQFGSYYWDNASSRNVCMLGCGADIASDQNWLNLVQNWVGYSSFDSTGKRRVGGWNNNAVHENMTDVRGIIMYNNKQQVNNAVYFIFPSNFNGAKVYRPYMSITYDPPCKVPTSSRNWDINGAEPDMNPCWINRNTNDSNGLNTWQSWNKKMYLRNGARVFIDLNGFSDINKTFFWNLQAKYELGEKIIIGLNHFGG